MYSDENIRKRIWLIADGIPLKLDNMTIRTKDSGKLLVTGWTSTINFNNISKENILQELADLKSSFSDLSKAFTELNDIVTRNDLTIEYHIAFDDFGKAGIGLCSEVEGKLNWYID
ncbi:hypothetical protein [Lacibacter sediminis]|uniref:Uncharacterized protein n=1 Tax=Lacibacter sediminis TaxID=2760713 RepID=A0A7G5XM00_9BACT|nr:hypothetical protein [Lacibacter sediminis]QNA46503.1 hypothetical protein H4075_10130 [Lacibacter sediminis]